MKLIVGLGNPGQQYENNRHNVGFMAIDTFAQKYNIELDTKKKKAIFGIGKCNDERVVILKPQTFMNLSGEAVLYLASFYKIKHQNIIVVADDTELSFGSIRIRKRGGSGGHNGIKSLIFSLKTEDFPRLRIGIGRPSAESGIELTQYVLEDFSPEEIIVLEERLQDVAQALHCMITASVEEAMNRYNKKAVS